MTRVRRRSPVVEAVQWHKPGATFDGPSLAMRRWIRFALDTDPDLLTVPKEGDWIVREGKTYHVLSPEAFEREYEPAS